MREKITKRRVDALKPAANKDVFLWDTEVKGFGLRLKPSGARSFVLSYCAPGRHQCRRRMTLGAYGPLTVESARRQALELLARVAAGEDPAIEVADRLRANRDETVGALLPEYLADARDLLRSNTVAYYEGLVRLHILPGIGELPVAQVTAKDVATLHRSLRDKKVTANRVVQLLRAFFYWLERRGVRVGENPAAKTERFPEKSRERFLTVEEMGRLGDALRQAETTGLPPAPQHRKTASTKRTRNAGMFGSAPQVANPVTAAALRLLLLTGFREKEGLTLRWDAVDFDRGFVTLEDTKTGRSVRPLSAPALELIASQPRAEGDEYVFPGRVPGKPLQEIQRLWYAVRAAAGLEEVRLHDLRHSVASIAAEQGYSLFLIGKLLGHRDQRSTARYAHLADDARKSMADSVGGQIDQALRAIKTRPTNEIGSPSLRAVR